MITKEDAKDVVKLVIEELFKYLDKNGYEIIKKGQTNEG